MAFHNIHNSSTLHKHRCGLSEHLVRIFRTFGVPFRSIRCGLSEHPPKCGLQEHCLLSLLAINPIPHPSNPYPTTLHSLFLSIHVPAPTLFNPCFNFIQSQILLHQVLITSPSSCFSLSPVGLPLNPCRASPYPL